MKTLIDYITEAIGKPDKKTVINTLNTQFPKKAIISVLDQIHPNLFQTGWNNWAMWYKKSGIFLQFGIQNPAHKTFRMHDDGWEVYKKIAGVVDNAMVQKNVKWAAGPISSQDKVTFIEITDELRDVPENMHVFLNPSQNNPKEQITYITIMVDVDKIMV